MRNTPMPPRRQPMKRPTKPLARSPLKDGSKAALRSSRLAAKAKKPKRWILKRRDDAYRAWVKALPCTLHDVAGHVCWGPVDPHHVKTRGAGGSDAANLIPVCRGFHDEIHQRGRRTTEALYGLDLAHEAARLHARYLTLYPKENAA